MTGAIWVLLMTGGVAALLAAVSRRRFEEWAAPAVFLLTGAIYVFALAGAPELGCRAAQAMGLLSLLAAAVLAVRSREARCRILTPGAAAFALVVLVAGWAHRGQLYTIWDEFSHWGRVVNRLCALGTLPHAVPGALDFPSYPPGAALWEYAWVVLSGGTFSEGATISANNVALAVCFLPLMRYADWRRWKRAVPLLLASVMLPLAFLAYAYQNVYVDALLGAVAAYALIQWVTLPRGWERSAMTGAAMLALSLVKESGAFLALLAMAVMTLDLWREGRGTGARRFAALAAPVLCLLVGVASWKIYLALNGIGSEKPFRYWEIGENIALFLAGESPWHQQYLFSNFFRYLTMPQMMGEGHILKPCYLEWVMILCLAACYLARRRRAGGELCPKARRYGRAVAAMTAATAVYAVCLVHLYLYAFSESEAASLHSFDRYMASVMIPALSLAVALALESWEADPPRAVPAALAVLAGMMLLVAPAQLMSLTFTAPLQVEATQSLRGGFYPPAWVLEALPQDARVAWVTCGRDDENIYRTYVCNRYEFMPVELEAPCGMMLEGSPEDVAAALADYEYVYCFDADEDFIQAYGGLFENPDDIADKALYRVESAESGLRLVRVE